MPRPNRQRWRLGTPLVIALAGALGLGALGAVAVVGSESLTSSAVFSPDPCDGTFVTDTADDRTPWRVPLMHAVWSPDGRQLVGNFHDAQTDSGSVRVVNATTGAQRMLGAGITEALAWTKAGILVDGRDASRRRGDRRGWWIEQRSGARLWIGDGLLAPPSWHTWASPISPRGRYLVALEEPEQGGRADQLVVIPLATPATRIRIPKKVGTVLVGWTNADRPLVAQGDEYEHPMQRIRMISPTSGKAVQAVGPALNGPWVIAWSGNNRVAFLLEDRQYTRGPRTITRTPNAWLISANPRVRAKRLPAWSEWATANPGQDYWPQVTGLSARGAQVALRLSLKDGRTTTVNRAVTEWSSPAVMTNVDGRGALRPEAVGYHTDEQDFEASCSTALRPAPAGTLAVIDTMMAGCRGRNMRVRRGATGGRS